MPVSVLVTPVSCFFVFLFYQPPIRKQCCVSGAVRVPCSRTGHRLLWGGVRGRRGPWGGRGADRVRLWTRTAWIRWLCWAKGTEETLTQQLLNSDTIHISMHRWYRYKDDIFSHLGYVHRADFSVYMWPISDVFMTLTSHFIQLLHQPKVPKEAGQSKITFKLRTKTTFFSITSTHSTMSSSAQASGSHQGHRLFTLECDGITYIL